MASSTLKTDEFEAANYISESGVSSTVDKEAVPVEKSVVKPDMSADLPKLGQAKPGVKTVDQLPEEMFKKT